MSSGRRPQPIIAAGYAARSANLDAAIRAGASVVTYSDRHILATIGPLWGRAMRACRGSLF